MYSKLITPINAPIYLQLQNQLRISERLVTDATPLESVEPHRGETKNVLETNNTNQRSQLPPTTEPTA